MGEELKLLPFYMGDGDFSNDVISVKRDCNIFDKIRTLASKNVPDGFSGLTSDDGDCEDQHWGNVTEDRYGNKVKYVLAGDLKTVNIPGSAGAFINVMKDDDKIALFWC